MSAYLCSDDTFDYLATAASLFGRQHNALHVSASPGMPDLPALISDGVIDGPHASVHGITDTDRIARILRAENVRSLQARYPNGWDDMVGDGLYEFRSTMLDGIRPDPVNVIKSCDCLEYQSCEADDYRETLAFAVLNAIRDAAVRSLAGYDDAPWGWERPAQAVR